MTEDSKTPVIKLDKERLMMGDILKIEVAPAPSVEERKIYDYKIVVTRTDTSREKDCGNKIESRDDLSVTFWKATDDLPAGTYKVMLMKKNDKAKAYGEPIDVKFFKLIDMDIRKSMEEISEGLQDLNNTLAQPKEVKLSKAFFSVTDEKIVLYESIKEYLNTLDFDSFKSWLDHKYVDNNNILSYADMMDEIEDYLKNHCLFKSNLEKLTDSLRDKKSLWVSKHGLNPQKLDEEIDKVHEYQKIKVPYYEEIKSNIHDWKENEAIQAQVNSPIFIELIWTYWMEEGMLAQVINAIELRFQNKQIPYSKTQINNLDISPLYPLNGLLWELVEAKRSRLSVQRRAYEYDHQYGLKLYGKAAPKLHSVDSRKRFLEAFHNLLHISFDFYRSDADQTVRADGFSLLNALKDLHLVLADGAYNQYNGLAWKSRKEMMFQQYLLSRKEMREFLGSKVMSPVDDWIRNVDTVKKMMGKPDISTKYFSDLAERGEHILLSVRFGGWNESNIGEDDAKTWANFWKDDVQNYIYSYKVVTGVDLTAEKIDYAQPGSHIQRRMLAKE
ncbi:hypothetical protein DMA11_06970 [Marinilabiliaceae bacterium JC017]|nr:hypothetical protein DMA11_06970 [Marinilabiliaceae bacterium JC017]